jgi:NAD(P)H dehydrogenase (quinone)
LTYTIIREGPYAHQFTEFLNYNPDSAELVIPADGHVCWTSRSDLAEGTARIIHAPSAKYANKTLLLTGARAVSLTDVGKMMSTALGKDMAVITVPMDAWITGAVDAGIDQWTAEHFYGSMYTAIQKEDLETVSGTLEELLGRRPQDIEDVVKEKFAKI